MMKVTTTWKEAMAFDCTSDNGHTIRLDTTKENGSLDSGMNPKKLLLGSLSGCSAMDVVDILTKMKVAFSDLTVTASAEQTEEHPKVFTFIELVYNCKMLQEDEDKFKRAVALSMEKYCGIAAMLSKACPINVSTQIIS